MSALHDKIGKRALELLPLWERDFWKDELSEIPDYCFYPDWHLEAQEDPAAMARYEKYCIMPDGHCIPHGVVDSDWVSVSLSGKSADPKPAEQVICYYLKTILALLQKKDVPESARFAGTFAHFIQDCCTTVHLVNNLLINTLFPASRGKYFFYHRLVDSWPFYPDQVEGKPELLGRTPEEAAFVIRERLDRNIERSLGLLVPFLSAIRDGRNDDADKFSQRMNTDAVQFTADVWHTLFCIAFRRFSAEECANLANRSLTDGKMILSNDRMFDRKQFIAAGIPFYTTIFPTSDPCRSRLSTDPYPYEPSVDSAYDGKGNLIPLSLKIKGKTVTAEKGIAVGGYGIASYRVPGELYSELEVYAGVHPASVSNQEIIFAVWSYELEQPLLAMGKASKQTNALHFVIPLPESCRTISLLSAGGNRNTSAIWLHPTIKSRLEGKNNESQSGT